MIHVEHTITIARAPDEVARYMARMENEAQWWEGLKSIKLLAGESGKVGAKYERVFTAMGRERQTTVDIVTFESSRELVVKSAPGPVVVTGTAHFEKVSTGTKLHFTIDASTHGFSKLLTPMIRKNMAKTLPTSLERLKTVLETAKPAAAKPAAKKRTKGQKK